MTQGAKAQIQYLVGGLLIGGFWYVNRGRPPWEEALRTIMVFAILIVVMRARLRCKSGDVHLVPLLATKAVLVAVAALIQGALLPVMGDAALVVAVGLALVVALLGPLGDQYFFARKRPVSTP